jgi:xanthine dehydrogenase YagS FAD-binding subunit
MNDFEYVTAASLGKVPSLLGKKRGESLVLAGGTDLLDRMKERIDRPKRLVNLKRIGELEGIESSREGVAIGALTRIADLASDPNVARRWPVLAEAAASIATPQLRNMGTIGGNLCQRPRCWYYRDHEVRCLKKGGDTCYAVNGLNKYHAIFGDGPCFIVHPSDAAIALVALEAEIEIVGPNGSRRVAAGDFFRMPDVDVAKENILEPDEVVARIHVRNKALGTVSTYRKFREKQSLDFAIVSVAAVVYREGIMVRGARIVLGGVAPVPWRARSAEKALTGKPLDLDTVRAASLAAIEGASPLEHNEYKVPLARNLVRSTLESLAEGGDRKEDR